MERLFLSFIVCIMTFTVIEWISGKLISPRPPIERRFPVQEVRYPRPYPWLLGLYRGHSSDPFHNPRNETERSCIHMKCPGNTSAGGSLGQGSVRWA